MVMNLLRINFVCGASSNQQLYKYSSSRKLAECLHYKCDRCHFFNGPIILMRLFLLEGTLTAHLDSYLWPRVLLNIRTLVS